GLDQHDPPGVVAEVGGRHLVPGVLRQHRPRRDVAQKCAAHHRSSPSLTAATAPPAGGGAATGPPGRAAAETCTTAPASAPRVARTAEPVELVGTHTTPSGIGVSTSGSVTCPRSVRTVTASPFVTPSRSPSAGETRATG